MVTLNFSASGKISGIAGWKYKLTLLALFAFAYCFLYIYPNLYGLDKSRQLTLSAIDRGVPFLPWTFVVYLSEYLLIITTIVLIKNYGNFTSFARLGFGALIISGIIFIFYPTSYPRPVYPTEINLLIKSAMNIVDTMDTPSNCFPSLHVAISAIAVYSLRFLRPMIWFFFCLWGLAIIASTLTTKQHYFIDIVGGLFVVLIVLALERILFKKASAKYDAIIRFNKLDSIPESIERKYN